jgi:L-alanine-DL-glutamate epimerase-like enolase superfamily enzyme
MRITAIETVQAPDLPNLLWVQVHTDAGLVGLGETFRASDATAAYIHTSCAPFLLGRDPREPARIAEALLHEMGDRFFGYPTRSVELRALSALDIAFWDILGQSLGAPIHALLGGLCRDRIRGYNTCANPSYNRGAARYGGDLSLPGHGSAPAERYADYDAAQTRPDELALDLLEQGVDAMKIWPFDGFAAVNGGAEIALADLRRGVALVERIRAAAGDRMEILMEYHGRWRLPAAQRIAAALRHLDILFHEDPVPMEGLDDLSRYRDALGGASWVAGCESHGTRAWFRDAFARGAIDVALFDIGWIGGITEAQRVVALAHAHDRPVAPHDCVGPVVLAASVHVVMSAPLAFRQEFVRSYVNGFYRDCVTHLPRIEQGWVHPMQGPGLGTKLHPALLARPDLRRRVTGAD